MKKRILRHPDFALIDKGLKPALFLSLAKNKSAYTPYKIETITKDICYFVEPWFGRLNIMIIRRDLLEDILPLINRTQNQFSFKNSRELVRFILHRYQYRDQVKLLSLAEKRAHTLIEGLCFGFPLKTVKAFVKEITNYKKIKELRKDRIIYRLTEDIVFIGYPEYKSETDALIRKWRRALK